MFGFTQKKRKRNANKRKMKNNNKRISFRIEELDTPDTPEAPDEQADDASELTPYEPIVLNLNNKNKKIRTRRGNNKRNSNKNIRFSQRLRSRSHHRHRVRTPTPYPHQTQAQPMTTPATPLSDFHGTAMAPKTLKLKSEGDMIVFFVEMLNTVKLYHWKTHSFATHKATDELYDDLNKYVDEFVEVMLGYKGGIRVNLPRTSVKLNDFSTAEQFKRKLNEYKTTLISYTHKLDPNENSDLLNIRDELLATLNKTAYLLSFR